MSEKLNDGDIDKADDALMVTNEGLAAASGSSSDAFGEELLSQVMKATWKPEWKTTEKKARAAKAAYDALQAMAPRDEVEGMLAAQMISTHNAAMECLRRAMGEKQTLIGRDQNLKYATKLMGIYERQLAALDRHRGQGQQKITVEHVTVEAGGQAIVGNVKTTSKKSANLSAPASLEHKPDDGVSIESATLQEAVPEPRARKQRVK